jgi:hypothetical protein
MTAFIFGFVLGGATWPLISLIFRAVGRVLVNALKEET